MLIFFQVMRHQQGNDGIWVSNNRLFDFNSSTSASPFANNMNNDWTAGIMTPQHMFGGGPLAQQ